MKNGIVAGGIAAVALAGGIMLFAPSSETGKQTKSNCNPNYSGCLKVNAVDYDCAGGSGNGPNYTGAVRVIGYDEFGLDRDGDGWGCEK